MRPPEEVFEAFGPAVVAEVRRHMRRSVTLGPLLRQLGVEPPRSVEEQYVTLLNYLDTYGPIHFLNEVSATDPANTMVYRKNILSGTGTRPRPPGPLPTAPQSPSPAAPPAASAQPPAAPPPTAPQASPAPSVPSSPPQNGNQPAPAASTTEAPQISPKPLPPVPGLKMITCPTYVGPDRRASLDRRSGPPDRRADLAVVFRNRRFGGWDRRKMVRREEDRIRLGLQQPPKDNPEK